MRRYGVAIGVLLLTSLGDYITTVVGVSSGEMAEANPTAVEFMNSFGVFVGFGLLSLIGLVLIMGLASGLRRVNWRGSTIAAYAGIGVFAGGKLFATAWNTVLILS